MQRVIRAEFVLSNICTFEADRRQHLKTLLFFLMAETNILHSFIEEHHETDCL